VDVVALAAGQRLVRVVPRAGRRNGIKLPDQVVAQLANALRYELGMAEAAKGARAQNPDAVDLAMRGWAVMPPHSMPSKDQVDAARPLFEQALKIDPDMRCFEQAKSDVQQAMLLSPRDPAMSQWFSLRADPELGLGRFDEALKDAKKAVDGGYRTFYVYIHLAAAHAFKGEMDEAKAATAEARRLKPDLSVKWLVKHKPGAAVRVRRPPQGWAARGVKRIARPARGGRHPRRSTRVPLPCKIA
jgi:tetratricopeptide (TPR) repeat protein